MHGHLNVRFMYLPDDDRVEVETRWRHINDKWSFTFLMCDLLDPILYDHFCSFTVAAVLSGNVNRHASAVHKH